LRGGRVRENMSHCNRALMKEKKIRGQTTGGLAGEVGGTGGRGPLIFF